MKKKLLIILSLVFTYNLCAQTQTVGIDWTFGSNSNVVPSTASNNADRTIEVGDTVTWTWSANGSSHNVRSTSGETFESAFSGIMGNTFSHTFTTIGSSNYQCDPHSGSMYGTITVVSEGTLSVNSVTLNAVGVYPNPVSDYLNIALPVKIDGGLNIELIDVLGKSIIRQKSNDLLIQISISELKTGIYLLKISSTSDNIAVTKRFVKI